MWHGSTFHMNNMDQGIEMKIMQGLDHKLTIYFNEENHARLVFIIQLPSGEFDLGQQCPEDGKLDLSKIEDEDTFTLKFYRSESLLMVDVNEDRKVLIDMINSECLDFWPTTKIDKVFYYLDPYPDNSIEVYLRNAEMVKRIESKGEIVC